MDPRTIEPAVEVDTTYTYTLPEAIDFFPPAVSQACRIEKVIVAIEVGDDLDEPYVRDRCYGITLTAKGKPDQRSRRDWYQYPPYEWRKPFIDDARRRAGLPEERA